jgi:hypothetical protein
MRGSVYAYKSGKRVEDPFTPDTRIGEGLGLMLSFVFGCKDNF